MFFSKEWGKDCIFLDPFPHKPIKTKLKRGEESQSSDTKGRSYFFHAPLINAGLF